MQNKALIRSLFDLGAVQFGSFQLKSGIQSPVYIDLRLTISNPKLLTAIGESLYHVVRGPSFDLICGVPYTALPFATAISIAHHLPMILRRKERKEYGTGKILEGIYHRGQNCLLIEDVITSGKSLLETIGPLEEEGIVVKTIAVLVDREQGGAALLRENGYSVHPVLSITEIVRSLLDDKKISEDHAKSTLDFIKTHQIQR